MHMFTFCLFSKIHHHNYKAKFAMKSVQTLQMHKAADTWRKCHFSKSLIEGFKTPTSREPNFIWMSFFHDPEWLFSLSSAVLSFNNMISVHCFSFILHSLKSISTHKHSSNNLKKSSINLFSSSFKMICRVLRWNGRKDFRRHQ